MCVLSRSLSLLSLPSSASPSSSCRKKLVYCRGRNDPKFQLGIFVSEYKILSSTTMELCYLQWKSDTANSFGQKFKLYTLLWQSYRLLHEIQMWQLETNGSLMRKALLSVRVSPVIHRAANVILLFKLLTTRCLMFPCNISFVWLSYKIPICQVGTKREGIFKKQWQCFKTKS